MSQDISNKKIQYNKLNLLDKQFNDLSVCEFAYVKNMKTYWKCLCVCGNYITVRGSRLTSGNTKSCGCRRIKTNKSRLIDLCGQKIGFLTVLNREYSDCDRTVWKCRCTCGNEILVDRKCLRKKLIRSCGCKSKQLREETTLKNFGVKNPSFSIEVCSKRSKNINKRIISHNWETGDGIICIASYEKKFTDYLNTNKIRFDWQIPFRMPSGSLYIVDCYLKDLNKYIEIKGYKRPKSMMKWEWFHEKYPNSELLDKQKLKEMKII